MEDQAGVSSDATENNHDDANDSTMMASGGAAIAEFNSTAYIAPVGIDDIPCNPNDEHDAVQKQEQNRARKDLILRQYDKVEKSLEGKSRECSGEAQSSVEECPPQGESQEDGLATRAINVQDCNEEPSKFPQNLPAENFKDVLETVDNKQATKFVKGPAELPVAAADTEAQPSASYNTARIQGNRIIHKPTMRNFNTKKGGTATMSTASSTETGPGTPSKSENSNLSQSSNFTAGIKQRTQISLASNVKGALDTVKRNTFEKSVGIPRNATTFRSVFLRRRVVWSLVLVYVVMVILSFMQTFVLEATNPRAEMDKRLAAFSKPVGHHRPRYDPHNKTLALLYPLGMIGGYRNQVIRYISFVRYAMNNNVSQMLLPSIVWSTVHVEAKNRKRFFPVPMEMLFDVDHWNSFHGELPILVDTIEDSDCWGLHDPHEYHLPERTETQYVSALSQKVLEENALLTPVVNYSRSLLSGELKIRPRKFNLYPMISNCTHPVVYGGGKGGGKLWNDYVSMPKLGIRNRVTPEATENSRVISLINQALTPNRQWRNVAHQCVLQHQPIQTSSLYGQATTGVSNYVALHARIETDMMQHKCGKFMQKNLTKIFGMVDDLVNRYNVNKTESDQMHGVFVAVSRYGMRIPSNDTTLQELSDYNWDVLLERSVTQNPNRKSAAQEESLMFECGEMWTDRWYATQDDIEHDYYGTILPSIINFYIATHASIFIGVQGSSWSTDVWNTRFHQGKGAGNYEYTKIGILPLPDGGLPPPHQNCKEIKFRKDEEEETKE